MVRRNGPRTWREDQLRAQQPQGVADCQARSEPIRANHQADAAKLGISDCHAVTQAVKIVCHFEFVDFAVVQQQFAARGNENRRIEDPITGPFDQTGAEENTMLPGCTREGAEHLPIGDGFRLGHTFRVHPAKRNCFRQENHSGSCIRGAAHKMKQVRQVRRPGIRLNVGLRHRNLECPHTRQGKEWRRCRQSSFKPALKCLDGIHSRAQRARVWIVR